MFFFLGLDLDYNGGGDVMEWRAHNQNQTCILQSTRLDLAYLLAFIRHDYHPTSPESPHPHHLQLFLLQSGLSPTCFFFSQNLAKDLVKMGKWDGDHKMYVCTIQELGWELLRTTSQSDQVGGDDDDDYEI